MLFTRQARRRREKNYLLPPFFYLTSQVQTFIFFFSLSLSPTGSRKEKKRCNVIKGGLFCDVKTTPCLEGVVIQVCLGIVRLIPYFLYLDLLLKELEQRT